MSWTPALLAGAYATALLLLTAVPVFLSRNATIKARWATWVVIAIITGLAQIAGLVGAAVLAAAVGILCAVEYRRLVGFRRLDLAFLTVAVAGTVAAAVVWPSALTTVLAWMLGAAALLPIVFSQAAAGAQRATFLVFGVLWLAWAPAQLVLLHEQLAVVVFAVGLTDVASWAAGKSLRRLPLLRVRPFAVSPNKTVAGLLGGAFGAALALLGTGFFSWPLLAAVALGAPAGDLLASAFKRRAGVKDAGSWLPGFGGMLDRADSMLVVAPLMAFVLLVR